jgi:ribulose-phosphate 3-epimerase
MRRIESLRTTAPVVLPSMLLCDFANLQREVEQLEASGAKGFHLDVMDGVFVPNFTYGLPIVEAFRRLTKLPLDVHLMISKPDAWVKRFTDAGADCITFHIEATDDPEPVLRDLRELNVGVGLAINPKTPISRIQPYLSFCDLALVMSVEAGFGGQPFDHHALEKIRQLKAFAQPELLIEVDGGVNEKTIAECARAGADLFVVGSAIFPSPDYRAVIGRLDALAASSSIA